MMRWRVLAQAGTVLAVAWGLYMKVQWSSHTDAATTTPHPEMPGAALRAIDKTWFFENSVEANSTKNRHLLPTFKAKGTVAASSPEPLP